MKTEPTRRPGDGHLPNKRLTPIRATPKAVPAGGIAFSYVYFEAGDFTGTETFEYQVEASPTDTSGMATLPISEATVVERDVVGLVVNPGTDPIPGALVGLACFNDAEELTYAYRGDTDGDEIAPGGFAGFTLPSGGDCTSAVLAASG
jgi:hypothetical protein